MSDRLYSVPWTFISLKMKNGWVRCISASRTPFTHYFIRFSQDFFKFHATFLQSTINFEVLLNFYLIFLAKRHQRLIIFVIKITSTSISIEISFLLSENFLLRRFHSWFQILTSFQTKNFSFHVRFQPIFMPYQQKNSHFYNHTPI